MEDQETKVEEQAAPSESVEISHEELEQKPVKKNKTLFVIVGIILALIVLGKIGGAKKQATTSENQTATATPVATPMAITAKELGDDFDANQVAAEAKWEGKLVQFTAKISNITDSGISFYNVSSKEISMTQISCKVLDKEELLPLKNGQSVTVVGTVGKQTIGVIDVDDCKVVK